MERYKHWAQDAADEVVKVFPNEKLYTCAAGTSPSGTVHIGNFRDLITADLIHKSLLANGKKSRLIMSWDDYDRFRKVPAGLPDSYEEHIGKPLSAVPDPKGEYASFAERNEKEFEKALVEVGITPEYISQTKMYQSGIYDGQIIFALKKRKEIAKILSRFMTQGMTDEAIENYYPIAIYSSFTGKDNIQVLNFDGDSSVTYRCLDTKKEETIDIRKKRIVKLAWKTDWPMRWLHESVTFEPGGKDHASKNSSYDVGKVLSKEIFNRPAPPFVAYEFIGIKGLQGKMSGSAGNLVSLKEILSIYEPTILRWLYTKIKPLATFDFAFGEDIIRQISEFDKEVSRFKKGKFSGQEKESKESILELSKTSEDYEYSDNPIPFRTLKGYAQLADFDSKKLQMILEMEGKEYDPKSIESRLPRVKVWLEEYNPDEMFKLRETPNSEYYNSLEDKDKSHINELKDKINNKELSLKDIETTVYAIPKGGSTNEEEFKPKQRKFFKNLYQLLMDSDTGPRLPTFLWVMDRERILNLLDFN